MPVPFRWIFHPASLIRIRMKRTIGRIEEIRFTHHTGFANEYRLFPTFHHITVLTISIKTTDRAAVHAHITDGE